MKTVMMTRPPDPNAGPATQRPGQLHPPSYPPPPPQAPQARPPVAVPSQAAAHPLIDPMACAFADLLTLASQLEQGAVPPSADALRRQVTEMIAAMENRARSLGIALEDAREGAYAVMALLDELLIRIPWPGQREWKSSPLQYIYFRENTAGQNFFGRAEVLMSQPHRAHVLYVYFAALALGFQGRYAVGDPQGLAGVFDAVGRTLGQYTGPSDPPSPHGVPTDIEDHALRRQMPVIRLSLAILGVGVFLFFMLRFALSYQVSSAVEPMHDFATSSDLGRR